MRCKWKWFAAVAVTLLAGGLASAQPKAEAGPTVEARLRSVGDLLDKFDYLAGLVGQKDFATQVREIVKSWSADGKGIEGVDPKKPFGAYAILHKDIKTSPFVLMIPVASEEQLIQALKNRFDITAEKEEGGTWKIPVQQVEEVHARFLNGYAYVSQNAKTLDPKTLVSPKDYFANDDGSVASIVFHVDRVPEELRTFAFGQLELGLNEAKKNAENQDPAQKHFTNLVSDMLLGALKGVAEDGKEFAAKIFVDPKTDVISGELSFTAKSGTTTAKNIAALGERKSLPVGIVAAAGEPVAHGSVKVGVPENLMKDYKAAIETFLTQVVKDAPDEQRELIKKAVDALGPTLKAGELDAAAGLVGPDSKGRYQVVGAFAVREGKQIEKLLKDLVKQFGGLVENEVEFKFDVETVGDFTLHRIDIKNAPPEVEKRFGTKTVWLATSDRTLAFSVEPEGATIRKAVKAEPGKAPVGVIEVSLSKLVLLVDPELKPEEMKAKVKEIFGDGAVGEKDRASLSVTGGERLTVKFQIKGKGISVLAGLEALKGKKE